MLSRRLHNDEGSECAVLHFWTVFGLNLWMAWLVLLLLGMMMQWMVEHEILAAWLS